MAKKLPCFFLANDASSEGKAFRNAEQVANVEGPYGMKLNLDLVTKDWSIIRRMGDFTGRPIFVDMKMWNGKRTMAEIVQAVADEGGAMVNAYASAERLLEKASEVARDTGVVLLGVTVLTHYDDAYCRRIYRRSMNDTVRMFAEMSMRWGCNGYILPGTTLGAVADLGGIKFNPAVRPAWFANKDANDQKQIMTPREALDAGASIVSCGSPVFKSPHPEDAFRRILEEVGD